MFLETKRKINQNYKHLDKCFQFKSLKSRWSKDNYFVNFLIR